MRGEGGEDLEGHLRKGHKSAVFLMKSALWGGRVIPSELGRPEQVGASLSASLSLALSLNLREPEPVPAHGDGDAEPYSSLLPSLPCSSIYSLHNLRIRINTHSSNKLLSASVPPTARVTLT
jgi:hypothetical protein